jgi:hypothetical protein
MASSLFAISKRSGGEKAKSRKGLPQTQFILKPFEMSSLAISKANFPKPIDLWNQ